MNILFFGITRDIVNEGSIDIESSQSSIENVGELRTYLVNRYPALEKLSSLAIAVNSNYVGDDFLLSKNDEIALIPPVSGG